MDRKVLRTLFIAVACGLLLFCGLPFFWFFHYCPVPHNLLSVERQIPVGMTVAEARRKMPVNYWSVETNAELEAYEIDEAEITTAQENGFTGYLRALDSVSVQCQGDIAVECRDGIVTGVTVGLYDDLDHGYREFD